MSLTAMVTPPPNRSLPERTVPRLTARARALMTALNLHLAGVAALALLDLYLIVHLIFLWQGLNANNADALDQQRVQLIAAQISAKPLRGLDTKLVTSTHDANVFYETRLPYANSQVLAEIGALTHKTGVRWTHAQYAYNPQLSGSDGLNQMSIDASVSGDYRPIVEFINSVERDKLFFVINGINLTGQQTGQVNLRIRLTTYLRPATGSEELSAEMPVATASDAAHHDGETGGPR
jgi:type IV pilus assembly protein PilO